MTEFLQVIAIALVPALGNFAGGARRGRFCGISHRVSAVAPVGASYRRLNRSVGGRRRAGAALYGANRPWVTILAFLAGGGLAVGVDLMIGRLLKRFGCEKKATGAWRSFLGRPSISSATGS